jgi:hypothetical protein
VHFGALGLWVGLPGLLPLGTALFLLRRWCVPVAFSAWQWIQLQRELTTA